MPRQLRQSSFNPIAAQNAHIPTHVVHLLKAVGPLAICLLVITVQILAFQSKPIWATAHIPEKSREVIAPFRTHRDPASTISVIFNRVLVKASQLGITPSEVLSRVSFPMLEIEAFGSALIVVTTAAGRASGNQATGKDKSFFPADASAVVSNQWSLMRAFPQDGKTSEDSVFKVNLSWHAPSIVLHNGA